MTSRASEYYYEDENAYELFSYIECEIDNFTYVDKEDQMYGIVYYVNLYYDYRIDIDAPEHTEFITNVVDNCYDALNKLEFPRIEVGESEMSYIQELFEAQTIAMIKSVIKDFREYIN